MRLIVLLVIFSTIGVGATHAENNEAAKTLVFDYKFLATPGCTAAPTTPQYNEGWLSQDSLTGKDLDRIKQFIFQINQDQNSHNMTMQMRALDQQDMTIPHANFFLNITKQNQTESRLLFHTHSGLLTLQINQANNQTDWTPMAEQESYAGGFTTISDTIPVDIPTLEDGKYHTDVEVFGAFNDKNIFIPNCAPKFDSEFSVKDRIVSDVNQILEQTTDVKTESPQAPISKTKQICNDPAETKCLKVTEVLNPALTIPFKKSDTVLVGKIIDAESIPDQNKTKYSISVEKYLKNPKPNDLIVATGEGLASKEPLMYSELEFYNSPIFEKGDKVFVYLKNKDSNYDVLPYSFGIDKSRIPFRGPPPEHVRFDPGKTEYSFGDLMIISGKVQKGNLFSSAVHYNANSTIEIKVSGPGNSPYLSDKLDVDENGQFRYDFKMKSDAKAGTYDYMVTTGFSGTGSSFQYINSPLKQFDSGVNWYDIQCSEDKVIIQRETYPACVNFDTAITLYKRGVASNMENDVWNKWAQNTAKKYFVANLAKSFTIEENSLDIGLVGVRESLPPLVTIGIHFTSINGQQKIPHDFWFGISNGDQIDKILESSDDGKTKTEIKVETAASMRKPVLTFSDFKDVSFGTQTLGSLVSKFGPPDNDIGSGIHIYVYNLDDLTQIWIGYTDYVLYVAHMNSDGNSLEQLYAKSEATNSEVIIVGKDAFDICFAADIPCPPSPAFSGKKSDDDSILVTISGTKTFDVKLNQTHACVISESETRCMVR